MLTVSIGTWMELTPLDPWIVKRSLTKFSIIGNDHRIRGAVAYGLLTGWQIPKKDWEEVENVFSEGRSGICKNLLQQMLS